VIAGLDRVDNGQGDLRLPIGDRRLDGGEIGADFGRMAARTTQLSDERLLLGHAFGVGLQCGLARLDGVARGCQSPD